MTLWQRAHPFSSHIFFDQHQQLPEDPAHIPSVDFVDNREIRQFLVVRRPLAELVKNAIAKFKALIVRLVPHNKAFFNRIIAHLSHYYTQYSISNSCPARFPSDVTANCFNCPPLPPYPATAKYYRPPYSPPAAEKVLSLHDAILSPAFFPVP